MSFLKGPAFAARTEGSIKLETAAVVETQKESHERQTQVATKGQGQKRNEITGNSLQLANNSKRQKPGSEPSSSSLF